MRWTAWEKDILGDLARACGLPVEFFGRAGQGVGHLAAQLLYRQAKLLRVVRAFKPDVVLAVAGTFVSFVGWLTRTPVYVFYDTEHATVSNLLAYPFATCVYVPRCYRKRIRWRHQRYNGYHELAYLHPRYFTPDPSAVTAAGLKADEQFAIVRFVGWAAAHDIGRRGLGRREKSRIVAELGQHARVVISAEGPLPPELEPYRLRTDVSRIHHIIAHAALVFGESATMLSEAAVLGVPGIYVSPLRLGYLEEEEHEYGLVFNYSPDRLPDALALGKQILAECDRAAWQARRERLLADKIDVTEMIYEIVQQHAGRPSAKKPGSAPGRPPG